MIDFPCTCGYRFSVPQELAGSNLQCPDCKRLCDVPKLSDMGHLEDDGTIRLIEPGPEMVSAQDPAKIYQSGRTDDQGGEIDLRPTMDDVLDAGVVEEGVIGMSDEHAPPMPKYDPVTGELIEVLSIKKEGQQPLRAIPVGPPSLNYSRENVPTRVSMSGLPKALFTRPSSLAVMAMVLLIHVIGMIPVVLLGFGGIFVGFIFVFFSVIVLCAHYANIVEDMGPMDQDDLSTPLRGADVGSDIAIPFGRFVGTLFVCYMPAVLALGHKAYPAAAALALLGTFMFPGLLLTLCAGGDLVNLRPDRLFGTIARCGVHYAMSVILWVVASTVYLLGIFGTNAFGSMTIEWLMGRRRLGFWLSMSFLTLAAGIALMHAFCWHLGLIYRKRNEVFPWVLQRHTPTAMKDLVRRRRGPINTARKRKPAKPAPPRPIQPDSTRPVYLEPVEFRRH